MSQNDQVFVPAVYVVFAKASCYVCARANTGTRLHTHPSHLLGCCFDWWMLGHESYSVRFRDASEMVHDPPSYSLRVSHRCHVDEVVRLAVVSPPGGFLP